MKKSNRERNQNQQRRSQRNKKQRKNQNQQRRSQRNQNNSQQRRSQRNQNNRQQRRSQRNQNNRQQRQSQQRRSQRNKRQSQQRRSQRNKRQSQQRRSQRNKRQSQQRRSQRNQKQKRQRGGFSMLGSSGLMGTDLIGKCGSDGNGGSWITDWDEMSNPNSLEEGDIKSCGDGSLDMITGAEADLGNNEAKLSSLSDATSNIDVSKTNEKNLAANRKLASIQELKAIAEKNNDYDSLYAKYNVADGTSEKPYLTDVEFDYLKELTGTDGLGDKSRHENAAKIWNDTSEQTYMVNSDIHGIGPTAAEIKANSDATSAVQKELSDAWDTVKDSSKLQDSREVELGSLDESKWTPKKQTSQFIPTKKT